MNESWSEEALWLKARLFINRATDPDDRSFDELALWASLSLELLAKAALSRVSPLLIATPSEEGTNLLIASGLVQGDATFHTAPAKTIFTRCGRAFRPFNKDEALKIAAGRNEYLHAGSATFTALPPHAWWPRFWAQAVILLTAQDKDLEDFVGPDRVATVEAHLATNRRHVEERVATLLARAQQRLQMHQAGTMNARQAAEWSAAWDQSAGMDHRTNATCPACGNEGTLEGEQVLQQEMNYDQVSEDEYDAILDLTVAADYFSCPTCHLVLNNYEFLVEAGLPDDFAAVGDPADYADYGEYGND